MKESFELFYQLAVTLFGLTLLGFISGWCVNMLTRFMYRGMIFGWWLPLIAKMLVSKKDFSEKYIVDVNGVTFANEKEGKIFAENIYIELAQEKALYKILGGCVFCFGVWVTFAITIPVLIYFNINPLFCIFSCGASFMTIQRNNQ